MNVIRDGDRRAGRQRERGSNGMDNASKFRRGSRVINQALARYLGIKIVSTSRRNSHNDKIFSKCELKRSDEGYWFLDPMPSRQKLDLYYADGYWDLRGGRNFGVSARDTLHFLILRRQIPEVITGGSTILNFGAGHGGISHLCWLQGMQVVNVEPALIPKFYGDRWAAHQDICDVNSGSIDLVYGSHSLEHVQDLESFKEEVARVLKPGGFLFWEVPNAKHPTNGAQLGRVDIPHTYYFETEFFERWFSEVVICDVFQEAHIDGPIDQCCEEGSDSGTIIRALGKIK